MNHNEMKWIEEAEPDVLPCPGCGDPTGPCPNQSCVRMDLTDLEPCDYRGNPLP
jgi:hypothetical protein